MSVELGPEAGGEEAVAVQPARSVDDEDDETRKADVSAAKLQLSDGGWYVQENAIQLFGGIGVTAFTPIVYAPQVAILGVSRASTEPVWDGDQFNPSLVMPMSLTYDHRVIDGADGARFLRWICQAIEKPINLVMMG